MIRYRTGEQAATEELAAALTCILQNAQTTGFNTQGCCLWDGAAGDRTVGTSARSGGIGDGGGHLPPSVTVVIARPGQSSYSVSYSPTFITVSSECGIANVSTAERRVQNVKKTAIGIDYRRYKKAGRGFGPGLGTDAAGWIQYAIRFWGSHLPE